LLAFIDVRAGGAPNESAGTRLSPFLERLRAAGRAEVRLERRRFDPVEGAERVTRGRAALEPPAFARLDFAGGESVTLRSDGGEWLEPALRQLVQLGPDRARGALGWCDLLLDDRSGAITRRDLADGRLLWVRNEADAADSAWITLDTRGQPASLAYREGLGEIERVQLSHWTFARARGRGAFVLAAPSGYEVVELP